jgi:hypothetical protein
LIYINNLDDPTLCLSLFISKTDLDNIKNYTTLGNNSVAFTNNSNTFRIYINDASSQFTINDKIVIRGFQNYTINYKSLNFFFTNEKNYVILDLNPNFDFIIPYYDPISQANINYTKYNFTWNTTSITSYKLTIQLYFFEPDAISRFSI